MTMESIEVAVLLTDIVDSATHLAELGDLEFAKLMAELENDIRSMMRRFDGREIDKTDGFLVVFPNPVSGLKFALELNRHMMHVSRRIHRRLRVRTGLHYGNVVFRNNSEEHVSQGAKSMDIDGLTKVIAARVTSLADAGQLLVTRTIFNLVRENENSGTEFPQETQWLAHGPYLLHGLNEPVEIYEVGEPGIAPLEPPVSKPKARRSILPQDEFILGWRPAVGKMIPSAPKWKLVRKLGEGGYGEVWLAEQKTRQMRVFKFCFNPARIRSLQREKVLLNIIRENLGNRNDIVQIIDWNMGESPYFIALKYIPLDNLTAWMDQRGAGHPLSRETCLHIAHKAAEAIAAAHSVGILHKDVKPSNLLVGNDPARPDIYLIDFGIGLYTPLTDAEDGDNNNNTKSYQTTLRTSSISGSQMYIAPEVIEGAQPTTQADVYAMGVILYQLLCNDLSTGLHVGWQKKIDDPFLQEIIEQATNGNLQERFATMNRFIEALNNLDARRSEAAQKFHDDMFVMNQRKALERANRRRTYAMVAVGVALPLAVVAGLFAYRENYANEIAITKIREATSARDQANKLLGYILKDLNKHFMNSGSLPLLDNMTSEAISYYKAQPAQLKDNKALRNEALAYKNLGDILLKQRDFNNAQDNYIKCQNLTANLLSQSPRDFDLKHLLAGASYQRAIILRDQKQIDPAKEEFQKSLDLRRDLYGQNRKDIDNLKGLTEVCIDYANMFPQGGKAQPKLFREATTASLEAFRTDPNSIDAQVALAKGLLFTDRGITKHEKIENGEKLASILSTTLQANPGNVPVVAMLHKAYCKILENRQFDPELAMSRIDDGIEISHAATKLDPDNPSVMWDRVVLLNSAACSKIMAKDYVSANTLADQIHHSAVRLLDVHSTGSRMRDNCWNSRILQLHVAGLTDPVTKKGEVLSDLYQEYKNSSRLSLNTDIGYYHNIAIQRALYLHEPNVLNAALEGTTATAGTLGQLTQSRCAGTLLRCPQAFQSDSIRWSDVPSTSTIEWGKLEIDNQEQEVFVLRFYVPGSILPFSEQMVCAAPRNRYAVPGITVPALEGNYGVSINGSSIVPVYRISSFDTSKCVYKLHLSDWKKGHGNTAKYTMPEDYNVMASMSAQFTL